jgi:hypothetical protein
VAPPVPASPRPPSKQWWQEVAARQLPLLVVLVVTALGLIVVAADHWARGTLILAAALILAAGLRLALPERRAGLLVVRSRTFDVAALTGTAAAMIVIAATLR